MILLATASFACGQSSSPVINTIAGGGSGDNAPATSSPILPNCVAADASGNLFIADGGNVRVRKVATNGIITSVAGNGSFFPSGDGGPAINAGVLPSCVVMDSAGNLFIADHFNLAIRKVDPSGTISTLAAGGSGPGLAVDSKGNLFLTDEQRNVVLKVTLPGGSVSIVAGSGTAGFSGDGGAATAANLNRPMAVAVDSAGNVFIADTVNNRVRKVDISGTITTLAGNGTAGFSGDAGAATSASLNGPTGVAVDTAGNVFIADSLNNRVRKVDTTGVITTAVGTGTAFFLGDGGPASRAALNSPTAVAFDGSGNLFIVDQFNGRIRKVDTNNLISTVAGEGETSFVGDGGPATSAGLFEPMGAALDSAGNLFIADVFHNRIRRWDHASHTISTLAAVGLGLQLAEGLATDGAGNLYIANTNASVILKVDPSNNVTTVAGNGTKGFSGDHGPATSASLNFPTGVAVDGAGNVFIADSFNNRIRKVDASGTITTAAGNGTGTFAGDNGSATVASVNAPAGVAVDGAGNVFIADTFNSRIRKVDANGTITTVAGNGKFAFAGDNGPATAASLNVPRGVGVDGAGNLFIADTMNSRIRKVDSAGTITTVAGDAQPGFAGDGGPPTSASLGTPYGVAVDSHGNFFIADTFNNRVRQVTPPDFAVSASPASATVKAGQSATFTFTVGGAGGFSGSTSFSCSGLPALSTCTFTPASVSVSGNTPATVTLVIKTTGPNAALHPLGEPNPGQPFRLWAFNGSLGLLGMMFVAGNMGRRGKRGARASAMLGVILCFALIGAVGCGDGHSASSPTPTPTPITQTPAGTSTIVVTGSSGSTTHTVNVSLTVTP